MNPADPGSISALAIAFPLIVSVAVYLWTSFTLARVFRRLGISTWKAWVPVLNIAAIFTKAGIPAWYVILLFVPIANLFGIYQLATAFHRLNVAFGKGAGMTVLAVVLLPVWATIIGFEATAPRPAASQEVHVSDSVPPAAPLQPVSTPLQPVPTVAAPASAPAPAESAPAASAPPAPAPAVTPPPVAPAAAAEVPVAPVPAPEPPPAPAAPVAAAVAPVAPVAAAPVAAPAPVSIPSASAFAPPPVAEAPPVVAAAPVIAPPPGAAAIAPPPGQAALVSAPGPDPAPATDATPAEPVNPAEPVAPAEPEAPIERGQVVLEEPRTPPVSPAVEAASAPAPPVVATSEEIPQMDDDSEEDRTVVVQDESTDDADEEDGEDDHTVVVDRRPAIVWELVTEDGQRLPLTSGSVVLGRKPGPVPGSTALAVPDTTKTLSKVHARLDLADDVWTITDLGSTNGVLIVESDGTERILEGSGSSVVLGSFVLGKVVLAIEQAGGAG